mmetsp:Transcript_50638/g.147287  ORF Transcript_50638/g.147287 Transcript_50638/m.147287 type:complete len:210 (-) Transcript_50638:503-1132(-)
MQESAGPAKVDRQLRRPGLRERPLAAEDGDGGVLTPRGAGEHLRLGALRVEFAGPAQDVAVRRAAGSRSFLAILRRRHRPIGMGNREVLPPSILMRRRCRVVELAGRDLRLRLDVGERLHRAGFVALGANCRRHRGHLTVVGRLWARCQVQLLGPAGDADIQDEAAHLPAELPARQRLASDDRARRQLAGDGQVVLDVRPVRCAHRRLS